MGSTQAALPAQPADPALRFHFGRLGPVRVLELQAMATTAAVSFKSEKPVTQERFVKQNCEAHHNVVFLEKLQQLLEKSEQNFWIDMQKHLTAGDRKQVAEVAHKFKGTVTQFGDDTVLSNLLKFVQMLAEKRETTFVRDSLQTVEIICLISLLLPTIHECFAALFKIVTDRIAARIASKQSRSKP